MRYYFQTAFSFYFDGYHFSWLSWVTAKHEFKNSTKNNNFGCKLHVRDGNQSSLEWYKINNVMPYFMFSLRVLACN